MEICASDSIDGAGSEAAFDNLVVMQSLFCVSASQHNSYRLVPWVIVKTTIRIAGKKTMDIGTAAAREAKQVITLKVRLAMITENDATAQQACESIEQFIDEMNLFRHKFVIRVG